MEVEGVYKSCVLSLGCLENPGRARREEGGHVDVFKGIKCSDPIISEPECSFPLQPFLPMSPE